MSRIDMPSEVGGGPTIAIIAMLFAQYVQQIAKKLPKLARFVLEHSFPLNER